MAAMVIPALFGNIFSPLLLLFVTILLLLIYRRKQNSKNLPPGPLGIPLFGNLLQLKDKNILEELAIYRKKYGDVFKVHLGSYMVLVINGYDTIKEVFQRRGDEFYNRPDNYLNLHLFKHYGILGSNQQTWKEQRAFGTSTLRYFGVGKKNIEIPIREECECLINEIKKKYDKSFDIKDLIQNSTANIICSISFGKRYDYGDKKFVELARLMNELLASTLSLGLINAFPFGRYVPFDVFGQKQIMANFNHLKSYMQNQIDYHMESLDMAHPRDLIDLYILEMRKINDNNDSAFNEKHLVQILMDFFVAGTETTATVVRWSIIYLLHHPHIQEKLHKEIDSVIGSKFPKMENKNDMPYMASFIEEIMRVAIVAPLAFEHAPSEDTIINGYFIPKGTVLIPNLHSAAYDEQFFPEPEKFRPERFLDDNGKFRSSEKNIPFSIGRRVCLGESLAKTEVFLFLTSLLQHFEFLPSEEGLPSTQGVFSGTNAPRPYTMKAVPRM